MGDVFQFMNLARNPGEKVEAEVRKIEFKEIYQPVRNGRRRTVRALPGLRQPVLRMAMSGA